ncbi:phage tail protein [Vibrio sp. HN007]|uniref:phage tail protein n=1 Tax=Vibrio iocasae TaxID=3098914 RepID=UPI0035D414DB
MKTLVIKFLAILVSSLSLAAPTYASTDSQSNYIGDIKWVAFTFAPQGWAFCDGQLLPIAQNQSLFSLLGTTYGGDGRTTFALPDLRSRIMVHEGQGTNLTSRGLGEKGGQERVAINVAEMPGHTHVLKGTSDTANTTQPQVRTLATPRRSKVYSTGSPTINMDPTAIASAGGGLPHENMGPSITLNCIIAIQGLFPPRN